MVQSQFSLTWDKHRDNICKGFTSLQHNGEFVDMTIAAEGHFVKVHQMVLALASPYFKELLKSAPCQHPVIFLNNVSHSVLCHILQYIYTGEVILQAEDLSSFCDTAKALQICGMDEAVKGDLGDTHIENVPPTIVDTDFEPRVIHMSGLKTIGISSGDKVDKVDLPASARKIKVKAEKGTTTNFNISTIPRDDFPEPMESNNVIGDEYNDNNQSPPENTSLNIQFTASNRGCLQLILNRYLYNFHSIASRTGVRRWRCVDYRNYKCSAIVATKGNVVINRVNLHNHQFHDKKILSKVQRKSIYSALDDVKGVKNLPKPDENDHDHDHDDDDCVLEDETIISNII